MKFCINCGTQIPDVAKFCSSCGFKQPDSQGASAQPAPKEESSGVPKQSVKSATDEQTLASSDDQKPTAVLDDIAADQPKADDNQQPVTSSNGDVEKHINADNIGKTAADMVQSQIYFGPLTKDETIVAHKVSLGHSDRSDNYVLASTPINWSEILTTFRGLLGLRSKTYVLAFEDDGILLMGALGMQKFTGDDVFIESSRVTDIQLEKYPMAPWDHMFLTIDGEVLELLVASSAIYAKAMWFSIPWHLRNAKKVLKYTK